MARRPLDLQPALALLAKRARPRAAAAVHVHPETDAGQLARLDGELGRAPLPAADLPRRLRRDVPVGCAVVVDETGGVLRFIPLSRD